MASTMQRVLPRSSCKAVVLLLLVNCEAFSDDVLLAQTSPFLRHPHTVPHYGTYSGISGLTVGKEAPPKAEATAALNKVSAASPARPARASPASCAALENRGTHFTMDIAVGTPMAGTDPQTFSVVADTGSNALIVPSCSCKSCGRANKCFTGNDKSSSFILDEGPDGPFAMMIMFGSGAVQGVVAKDVVKVGNLSVNMSNGLVLMTDQKLEIEGGFEGILGLGIPGAKDAAKEEKAEVEVASGEGAAELTSDADAIVEEIFGAGKGDGGNAEADAIMKEILGAGEEEGGKAEAEAADAIMKEVLGAGEEDGGKAEADAADAIMKELFGDDLGRDLEAAMAKPVQAQSLINAWHIGAAASFAEIGLGSRFPIDTGSDEQKQKQSVRAVGNDSQPEPVGFLEEAGIDHFSMCFNEGASGVLRLGGEKGSQPHGSIGKLHWGLDLMGVSVGDKVESVVLCDKKNMSAGQDSACGFIPDSGTTMIMAPKAAVDSLFESICDGWERCRTNHSALIHAAKSAKAAAESKYGVDPFGITQNFSKSTVFQLLLSDCSRWLDESKLGLDELPPLKFHVAGPNEATKQSLALSGWAYVAETMQDAGEAVYKNIPGVGDVAVGINKTGVQKKVCSPAIASMPQDYVTSKNGQIWIVGTPLFYEFSVGYDLKADPPAMSFTSTKEKACGTCDNKLSLAAVGGGVAEHGRHGRAWRPRQVLGAPRLPKIDVTQPF